MTRPMPREEPVTQTTLLSRKGTLPSATVTTGRILLEAQRLFDGQTTRAPGRVLIDDGVIQSVGEAAPEGVERVQFGDATIMPGLLDAHVHLGFDVKPGIIERLAERDDEAILVDMAEAASVALRAGVTTVRDLGAHGDLIFRLRERIDSGAIEGPHILAAGRPLTIPLGHCYFLGGVARTRPSCWTWCEPKSNAAPTSSRSWPRAAR